MERASRFLIFRAMRCTLGDCWCPSIGYLDKTPKASKYSGIQVQLRRTECDSSFSGWDALFCAGCLCLRPRAAGPCIGVDNITRINSVYVDDPCGMLLLYFDFPPPRALRR